MLVLCAISLLKNLQGLLCEIKRRHTSVYTRFTDYISQGKFLQQFFGGTKTVYTNVEPVEYKVALS
jgi:hypothetical protein